MIYATENARTEQNQLLLLLLLFFSGVAALTYQVLWVRDLAILFGSTAQASSTVITGFFLGIALGNFVFARKLSTIKSPLRLYAVLEFAIAASVLLYFLILPLWHALYPIVFAQFGDQPAFITIIKFFMAVLLLVPTAFFMGGTLPAMSQHLIPNNSSLGDTGSRLYAINTFGATVGALLAGFFFPRWLGFTGTYLLAISISAGTGIFAWLLSRDCKAVESSNTQYDKNGKISKQNKFILSVAFLSGFGTLAMEVLWTRMFSQVLQNSVYTFSTILITFLLAATLGAVIANRLNKIQALTSLVLNHLLLITGVMISLSPLAFYFLTDGMGYLGGDSNWLSYTLLVFTNVIIIVGLPTCVLGVLFPYLLKLNESSQLSSGNIVGHLVGVNTTGAILGSITAGFILLETVGLWTAIWLIAGIYFFAALYNFFWNVRKINKGYILLYAAGLMSPVLLSSTLDLDTVRIDDKKKQERLLEKWESSAATVAVVEQPQGRKIKVNNHYALGGTATARFEAMQTDIPIYVHSNPKSVFFLGMGTGITAGRALIHPVESVTVAEIIPEVVTASEAYFREFTNGLFTDSRVRILHEDGRTVLAATPDKYDVIIGDLFIPWKAGTSNVYSLEHFQSVAESLNDGGLFAQWLPLYQLSKSEFLIIISTLMQVFPEVTLWRGDFSSKYPVVALVASKEKNVINPESLAPRLRGTESEEISAEHRNKLIGVFLLYYCGNLSTLRHNLEDVSVNTDDRPIIEYLAPQTNRKVKAKEISWFTGIALVDFLYDLIKQLPPEQDPNLDELDMEVKYYVRAGLALHRSNVLEKLGDTQKAKNARHYFRNITGNK